MKKRRAGYAEQSTVNLVHNFEDDDFDSYDVFPDVVAESDLTVNLTEINIAHSKEEDWYLDSGALDMLLDKRTSYQISKEETTPGLVPPEERD